MTSFDLHEGNTLTVTMAGEDDQTPPQSQPLDPAFEPTWVVDTTGVVAVSPVSGTFTCNFTTIPPVTAQTVTITGTADADLTSAVKQVTGQFTINVIPKTPPPMATHLVFTGTEKPTP